MNTKDVPENSATPIKPNYRIYFTDPIEALPGPWTFLGIHTFQGTSPPITRHIIAYPIPKRWGIGHNIFINRQGLVNYLIRKANSEKKF